LHFIVSVDGKQEVVDDSNIEKEEVGFVGDSLSDSSRVHELDPAFEILRQQRCLRARNKL
jgi:hypothetical protein